jgi:hypothetical protein
MSNVNGFTHSDYVAIFLNKLRVLKMPISRKLSDWVLRVWKICPNWPTFWFTCVATIFNPVVLCGYADLRCWWKKLYQFYFILVLNCSIVSCWNFFYIFILSGRNQPKLADEALSIHRRSVIVYTPAGTEPLCGYWICHILFSRNGPQFIIVW